MTIDDPEPFHYRPECHVDGCRSTTRYKLAASWTNGTSHELKNYGLACEDHLPQLLDRARTSRADLAMAEGEYVGDIMVYRLEPGRRDADLEPLPEPPVPGESTIRSREP